MNEESEDFFTLRRIERLIAKSPKDVSYRDYLIATMQIMNFTMEDGFKIYEDHRLQFDIIAANLTLCLKNGIRLIDLECFCNEKTFAESMKKIENNDSLSVLENEIKIMLEDSKALVREICEAIDCGLARKFRDSILKLFDDETRFRIDDIIKSSYICYLMFYFVEVEFIRSDGTSFCHILELAEKYSDMNRGLSGRPYIPDGAGMLYSFPEKGIYQFATTNVNRDLSVGYMDDEGKITEIIDRKADSDYAYANKESARYVIEITRGWFAENNVQVGDRMLMNKIGAMD
ncbi:MAG: DUF192 domain-containing protein [Spirochaetales bacterium]|nr:DUF192 domain-containing protein [Spirochaetales bacterium]